MGDYNFETSGMTFFSFAASICTWGLILSASARNKLAESSSANEVFFLTLTNIWRTTQMFYMTAPLTLYSIIMGTSDLLRNRSFGEDISYWVGGDRGAVSKSIVQCWTLLLVLLTLSAWVCNFAGILPNGSAAGA